MTGIDIAHRLAGVRSRIADSGGDIQRITIVAVTKGFGPEAITAAVAAGVGDVGENYAAELAAKHAAVDLPTCRWHFLGRVQRNKVRHIAGIVDLWQGVDRVAAGTEIARRAPGARVLVQINVSREPQKHGCRPEDAPQLVDELRRLGLDVRGLMALGPHGHPDAARAGFRCLSALADRLALPERSMGMTDDLEVAVEEGATMVRVGRALFGQRPAATGARR